VGKISGVGTRGICLSIVEILLKLAFSKKKRKFENFKPYTERTKYYVVFKASSTALKKLQIVSKNVARRKYHLKSYMCRESKQSMLYNLCKCLDQRKQYAFGSENFKLYIFCC